MYISKLEKDEFRFKISIWCCISVNVIMESWHGSYVSYVSYICNHVLIEHVMVRRPLKLMVQLNFRVSGDFC